MAELRTPNSGPRAPKGVTLIELMVVLTIFSVVMAGLYSAYSVQMKAGVKEYKLAESEMEYQIGKMVVERDLAMAGYGIADSYSAVTPSFVPRVVDATDGSPDTLTLVGTALGRESRAAQAWSYTMIESAATTTDYYSGQDGRENLKTGDRIIYMDPNTKILLGFTSVTNDVTGKSWLFTYPPSGMQNIRPNPLDKGVLVYGIQTAPSGTAGHADYPYYTVEYSLGGTVPSYCAPGTQNLLRSENKQDPPTDNGQPLFNCVLDFEVAFGIDNSEDGLIDCWDNGGALVAGYTTEALRTRLKQIKAYILVQQGNVDTNFTFQDTLRVGDASLTACNGGGVGKLRTFTSAQKNYRWKVISFSVTPRNIR